MALAVQLRSCKTKLVVAGVGFFFAITPALAQSRYGLSCYGDSCSAVDKKAESRMTNARTICSSGDSSISYPKKNKPSAGEMTIYWVDIHAAERVAESGFRAVEDCAQADLIVKITLDTMDDSVELLITDGDSGDSVFSEKRSVQDKRSDLIRTAQHFRDAVKRAKYAVQAEQSRLAEEFRGFPDWEKRIGVRPVCPQVFRFSEFSGG